MSKLQQDQFIDEDEEEVCPLCVEELDLQDRGFKPCPCGYQICQFCYNNIKNNNNGLCPACRRPYHEDTVQWKKITPEELASYAAEKKIKEKRNAAAKQKEAQKREADTLSRKHLAGLRVVQKNLVYVTGLSPSSREDKLLEVLRGDQYFGQYGKIVKIVVSKAKDTSHHQQSVGVYVTFARKEDAATCISAVDGTLNGDRTLRAQYGTTKYCSAYLRNETCNNRNCMFLHEPGDEGDRVTRQDLSSMNVQNSTQAHNALYPPPAQHPPIVAATQMHRQDSSEASNSPRLDVPALPATASWGSKALQQDRQASRTTASSEASPAISHTAPSQQPAEESKVESEPIKEQNAPSVNPATPSTAPQPRRRQTQEEEDIFWFGRPMRVFQKWDPTESQFSIDHLSEPERTEALNMPNLIDPNGGAKRRAMKEKLRKRQESEAHTATAIQAALADPEEDPGSGSLQLGGEPEDQPNGPFGRAQHAIGPPSAQSTLGLGGSLGLGQALNSTADYTSLLSGGRGLSAQQQQQLLLQQFKAGSQGHQANLARSAQDGPHLNSTAPSHARQTSKFSFANDSGTATTSVKPVANQKFMNQQASMMPQNASNFSQQGSLNQIPNNQFYSGVQGPPPGLKTTGTPPVSGGGMFGQGHGFATGGLGYGANAVGRQQNNSDELMRQLLRGQRPDGQGTEAGKRESHFPSFLQSHPSTTSTTPAPAPGLLSFPGYGPHPGMHDPVSQKPKKKGKKHRHANTSSSGGGGLVDVTDPSILQARLHHGNNNAIGGQSVYGGQGQGGFNSSMFSTGGGYRW